MACYNLRSVDHFKGKKGQIVDISIILTVTGTGIAIVGSNIALISWLRSDMKSFETEVRRLREEIHKELKDFHGRICAIQEKNNKKDL